MSATDRTSGGTTSPATAGTATPAPAAAAQTVTVSGKSTPKKKIPRPSQAARVAAGAPRKVRLVAAKVDPWSAMKMSFLLSVALGIMLVVALGVLWWVLDGMGIFADVNALISQIMGNDKLNVLDYVGLSKVLSLGTVLAVVNVVLITALGTLGAFLYNLASGLVGGLQVTLSDD